MYLTRRKRTNGLGSYWDDLVAYNTPSAWGSAAADAYYRVNYGNVPAIPEPSATTTPADQAAAVRASIQAAQDAGTWTGDPRLGTTATDVIAATNQYMPWVIGGVVGLGVLYALAVFKVGR